MDNQKDEKKNHIPLHGRLTLWAGGALFGLTSILGGLFAVQMSTGTDGDSWGVSLGVGLGTAMMATLILFFRFRSLLKASHGCTGSSGQVADLSDLSDRRAEQEEMLRKNKAMDAVSDAIGMTTVEGKHFYQNQAFTELFGYSLEEVQAMDEGLDAFCKDPDDGKAVRDSLQRGKHWSGEVVMRSKHKGEFICNLRADAVKDSEGNVITYVGIYSDISRQIEQEAELRYKALELEKSRQTALEMMEEANEARQAAEIMTDELQKNSLKLEEAYLTAQQGTIAKSQFLANMSHEIRTPLNGVIGMTDILLETRLSEEQSHYTQLIKSSGDALLALINDILDYSKIEAGKLDIEVIPFNLAQCVEDIMDILTARPCKGQFEFACAFSQDVPCGVRGDATRIKQVLLNLANNAFKFTEEGNVTLHVSLEEETETEATVLFKVSDTGIGIPEDRITALFEAFTQADGSTTRKYGGTGLGLTISRQLVELMNGEIGVDSEQGKGSSFWFRLPFEKTDGEPVDGVDVFAQKLAECKGRKVLFVDDNSVVRGILQDQLGGLGLDAVGAADGKEALEQLAGAAEGGSPFELALIDDDMPGMDGKALAKSIQSNAGAVKTRLILLAGLGETRKLEEIQALGFCDYLRKPIKWSELKGKLKHYLCSGTADGADGASSAQEGASFTKEQLSALRVLLVEDNKTNQLVAKGMLGKVGITVSIAENGQIALDACRETEYDLIFMDCQMPVMDGYEATRKIRELERETGHHPYIVAMTANAMKGDEEQCLASGMDDYLAKPIKKVHIIQMLERLFTCMTAS